jgi:hypothetical protein
VVVWHRVLVMTLALTALGTPVALAAPARTLIRNAALVLTMDPALGAGELGVREQVDLLLEGDTIAQIGPNLKVQGARVIDATGRIVLPGFVDTHDHLYQSLIRGCGTDQDLNGWEPACVIPLSRLITIGLRVALAPPVQTIGRLDLDQQPVLPVPGIDDVRRDRRHLHERISSCLRVSEGAPRPRRAWARAP